MAGLLRQLAAAVLEATRQQVLVLMQNIYTNVEQVSRMGMDISKKKSRRIGDLLEHEPDVLETY